MADFDYASFLGSLLGASQSSKVGKDVSTLSNQLKQSYTNPSSLYGQYSSNDNQFFNQLKAQNAAAGRSTDAYKTGVAREAAYNNWLNQYRSGLSNQLSQYANSASKYNSTNPWMTVLGTLLSSKKNADGTTQPSAINSYINSGVNSALGSLSNMYNNYNYNNAFKSDLSNTGIGSGQANNFSGWEDTAALGDWGNDNSSTSDNSTNTNTYSPSTETSTADNNYTGGLFNSDYLGNLFGG